MRVYKLFYQDKFTKDYKLVKLSTEKYLLLQKVIRDGMSSRYWIEEEEMSKLKYWLVKLVLGV